VFWRKLWRNQGQEESEITDGYGTSDMDEKRIAERVAKSITARKRKAWGSEEWSIRVSMDDSDGIINADIDGDDFGGAYDTDRSDEFKRGMDRLVKKFNSDVSNLMDKVIL
jgi:hypothetical protein